jgi:hypothetical protein
MKQLWWKGALLATAAAGLVTWQLTAPGPRLVMAKPAAESIDVSISPDGRYVVLCEHDFRVMQSTLRATATLRDATTGRLVSLLINSEMLIGFLAFSGDGRFVAGATDDGTRATIHVWETEHGSQVATFDAPRDRVQQVLVFSPEGRVLYGAYRENDCAVWDAASEQLQYTIDRPAGGGFDIPQTANLLITESGSTRTAYDLATGRRLFDVERSAFYVQVDLAPAGVQIVATNPVGDESTVDIEHADTGQRKTLFRGEGFSSPALSANGKWAAVCVERAKKFESGWFEKLYRRLRRDIGDSAAYEVWVCETADGREWGQVPGLWPKFSVDGSVLVVFRDQFIDLYDLPLRRPLTPALISAGVAGVLTSFLLRLYPRLRRAVRSR